MAEVMNMPVEALDSATTATTTTAGNNNNNSSSKSPDNTDNNSSPPPPARRRDRDSRERRDDRDFDGNNNNANNNNNRPYNRRGGGDYYPPRERDSRDYKRRASPSPPPPVHPMGGGGGYRDRRHSPSGRRSPPPYKRRRDDGYDGRRGGNRGRFGPGGDRRFPYNDYGGGFERNIGGRPQYDDDRSHGRYLGGPPDWDSGRGGFGDASNAEGTQREGLMSYKQFIQELEDDVLPAEAERRYQEYKTEYISTQKRTFFGAHKDEEWFKDKYHPTNLLSVIERRNELACKTAKDFMLDLQNGTLDLGPGINATTSAKSAQTSEPNSDNDAEVGGKRRRNRPAKESDLSGAPKAHPISSEPKRIQVDIEQAQALLRRLDAEKGIEENVLRGPDHEKPSREKSHSGSAGPVIIVRGLSSVKGLEGVELLDTMITYLWRIHGLDYYGMLETSEAKGLRHVRAEGKASDASSGAEWEKKLDSHWQERLVGQDPLEVMTAKEKIDAAAAEALDPYVRKIRDEKYGWKYGCGAKGCTKLFHAAEFVHKHLKLKHPELIMELTSKVREDLYFQNYMNDPKGPGSTPVMQQPTPKDKPNWRRLGLDNRLKDERGNRRDHENRGGGSDRFDRMENIQSMDFQSNNDGSERGKPDEPILDAFGAQGMHVGAPFSSEMGPPPVLMPVPGAGPLGPFVPAPPEVAMRMFREQGGPPPFEAAGRNVRPGPQLGGGPPFLALSPALRQDPRRLRSYNDLDVPEDEVTVIDYRSL